LEGGLDADTVLSDLPGFDDDDDDSSDVISLMSAAPGTADRSTDSDEDDAPIALADLDLGDIDDSDLGAVDAEDEKPRS
jgi:hypothetical protein